MGEKTTNGIVLVALREDDGEDEVAAGTTVVLLGRADMAELARLVKQLGRLLRRVHFHLLHAARFNTRTHQ